MKKSIFSYLLVFAAATMIATTFSSCGPKDADIKTAIMEKMQAMPDMAGMTAEVKDGVVTLAGEVKDEATKAMCESTATAIKGVKSVVNNCTVTPPPPPPAPVVIAADDPLTIGVNDAVKSFSGVKADVKDGVVTLTGDIKKAELKPLMMSLNTLKPKKIDNQLVIK